MCNPGQGFLPACSLPDLLIHLGEFGLQVGPQLLQQFRNSPLLLGETSLKHKQETKQERTCGRRGCCVILRRHVSAQVTAAEWNLNPKKSWRWHKHAGFMVPGAPEWASLPAEGSSPSGAQTAIGVSWGVSALLLDSSPMQIRVIFTTDISPQAGCSHPLMADSADMH